MAWPSRPCRCHMKMPNDRAQGSQRLAETLCGGRPELGGLELFRARSRTVSGMADTAMQAWNGHAQWPAYGSHRLAKRSLVAVLRPWALSFFEHKHYRSRQLDYMPASSVARWTRRMAIMKAAMRSLTFDCNDSCHTCSNASDSVWSSSCRTRSRLHR